MEMDREKNRKAQKEEVWRKKMGRLTVTDIVRPEIDKNASKTSPPAIEEKIPKKKAAAVAEQQKSPPKENVTVQTPERPQHYSPKRDPRVLLKLEKDGLNGSSTIAKEAEVKVEEKHTETTAMETEEVPFDINESESDFQYLYTEEMEVAPVTPPQNQPKSQIPSPRSSPPPKSPIPTLKMDSPKTPPKSPKTPTPSTTPRTPMSRGRSRSRSRSRSPISLRPSPNYKPQFRSRSPPRRSRSRSWSRSPFDLRYRSRSRARSTSRSRLGPSPRGRPRSRSRPRLSSRSRSPRRDDLLLRPRRDHSDSRSPLPPRRIGPDHYSPPRKRSRSPYREPGFIPIICKYYEYGKCKYGKICKNIH